MLPALGLEVVAELACGLPLAVHDVDQVGQVQHQVTGGAVAPQPLAHWLELERQVVAKCPVQAQVRVSARRKPR